MLPVLTWLCCYEGNKNELNPNNVCVRPQTNNRKAHLVASSEKTSEEFYFVFDVIISRKDCFRICGELKFFINLVFDVFTSRKGRFEL